MRIRPGEPAKLFSTSDTHGNPISLSDYRGQKLLLAFFRYAS